MKSIARYAVFLLVLLTGAFAQSGSTPESNPQFSQAELDQMLAPIALYPDAMLSQMLMAATYPLEVVEAARWSRANPELKGDAAVRAAGDQGWDPSVASLVAFPDVLATMDQKLDWTQRLGDAFLVQQAQVMDTVQSLRGKAEQAGNLKSNAQVAIAQDEGAIAIDPVDPQVVYIPYYDPNVVYGAWWWPDYPPVLWAPWPDYGWYDGFAWGLGFGVGADFFFGGWDWPHHRVFIHDPHHRQPHDPRRPHPEDRQAWQHDPAHRHGVPYRNATLNQQFGRVGSGADARRDFRGHERLSGSGGHQQPPDARTQMPEARSVPSPDVRDRPLIESRPHAFEGVGRGSDVRGFSDRGNQSFRSMPSSPAPPPSRGGHH